MYSFIKHTENNKRFEDRITVTRSRMIGFPTRFYKDNDIEKYKYAVLFYDKDKNAIGVKFTSADEAGKITINRSSNGYGAHISCTSFFKANRINSKKYAGRYEYKRVNLRDLGFEEEGNLFVIDLQEKPEKEEDG